MSPSTGTTGHETHAPVDAGRRRMSCRRDAAGRLRAGRWRRQDPCPRPRDGRSSARSCECARWDQQQGPVAHRRARSEFGGRPKNHRILEEIRSRRAQTSRTDSINLAPAYKTVREPNGNTRQEPDGYTANNMVRVKLTDMSRLGAFMRQVLDQGATNIGGVSFGLSQSGEICRRRTERRRSKMRFVRHSFWRTPPR